ncbi:hypothetical protein FG379_002647 [Cryptosporidium bovis]|uniref:uncharacterized protein n=1 Tax=Cryptosporidium bovis TaxID=310047 RepID=UPI00351A16F3|nr:hypothetical protein FG379_002647 [Cryptosporidium bovis]
MISYVKEEAYTKTPYIGYNIESLKYPSRDENKTYVALTSFGVENNYVEVLTYNGENNEFEIGYLYNHIFSPVGGVHWMPAKDVGLEENILGTGSDSIKLFKEGNMICDLRLNDTEQNNMRIESVYNTYFTKVTSFSFSNYTSEDLISTTIDGRCILWDLERPDKGKELGNINIFNYNKSKLNDDVYSKFGNKIIANIPAKANKSGFTIMDSCFGNSRNNILLGMSNGLAVSLDLRSPFKQINSILIDCMHGWSHAVSGNADYDGNLNLSPVKICNIENTNYFSRAILSTGEVEIFDIRKTCAPLYKINENFNVQENTKTINNSGDSIVSIENSCSGELIVSRKNGKVNKFSSIGGNNRIQMPNSFDLGKRLYGFSSINLSCSSKYRGFMGISSIFTDGQPGIVVSSYIGGVVLTGADTGTIVE